MLAAFVAVAAISQSDRGSVVLIARLWHEVAAFARVVHNGVERALDLRRITFNLDEGPSDLGTIELLASQFKFEPDKK